MKPKTRKLFLAILLAATVVLGTMFYNTLVSPSKKTFEKQSIVESNVDFTTSDQNGIDKFLDETAPDPLKPTPVFTIQTNSVLFDSNQKQYPNSTILGIKLEKQSLYDSDGHLLDLGDVQTSFLGIGKDTNKNLEIKAIAMFCLDTCTEKKLYAKGTTQNNKIQIYISDSYSIPTDKKTNFLFTFKDEGKNWADNSEHHYTITLKDIVFYDFIKDETWSFYGEDKIYDLKMTIDQGKMVILDPNKLDEAVSIFKKDNVFKVCASSGQTGQGLGNPNISPVSTPMITVNVDGKFYETIPVQTGKQNIVEAQKYFLDNHITSGGYTYPSVCKDVLLPRNAEIVAQINGIDYKFFTPKSQANFLLSCGNTVKGIEPAEYIYGAYRYANFAETYQCTSTIGYSK